MILKCGRFLPPAYCNVSDPGDVYQERKIRHTGNWGGKKEDKGQRGEMGIGGLKPRGKRGWVMFRGVRSGKSKRNAHWGLHRDWYQQEGVFCVAMSG